MVRVRFPPALSQLRTGPSTSRDKRRRRRQGALGRAIHPLSARQFGDWFIPLLLDRHQN